MKHFYVILNPDKEGARETALAVKKILSNSGVACQIGGEDHTKTRQGKHYTDASLVPEETECVITIGGDGTLIQAARDLAGRNIPMLGINRGTLGYLTQVSKTEQIDPALQAVLNNDFKLEERMMLNGYVKRNGKSVYQDIALNEIVLTRSGILKMLRFKVFVNGQFLNEYRADGLILATPTGSTAYNLSAGGPIIIPDSRMVVLTPICSHALNARSIVFSPEDFLQIEVMESNGVCQEAVFDGDTAAELLTGDIIEIQRAQICTTLIKFKNISFLDNLRSKMAVI